MTEGTLRPPAQHTDKALHWLGHPTMLARGIVADQEVAAWTGGVWKLLGDDRLFSPDELARAGWRYLGPAERKGRGSV